MLYLFNLDEHHHTALNFRKEIFKVLAHFVPHPFPAP